MLLGDRCTRRCGYCAVATGRPLPADPGEPARVADAAARLRLRYVVLTAVARDDLPDGGASQFAATVRAVRARVPHAQVEVLTPDFKGDRAALEAVLSARPDVFNHNVEMAPRLFPSLRPQGDYARSLAVLRDARRVRPGQLTKSGLMLGLGETDAEVREVLADLRGASVDIVTLGQYLRPTRHHAPVARYVPPADFGRWAEEARAQGFSTVHSGVFVRSSFNAEELFHGTAAAPPPAAGPVAP
jgi:lipoic acid synthetase